ncbi:MAG: type I restriction enzyme HsdR N-terminal domain-containing protein [Bacteroidales bacterium]|nr:type I restriction enzyme HsdR N-terminal domain-containing protein [Bacteroidales bacterium]
MPGMTDGMIFDPLRRKDVPLTPEERVRQWFIEQLKGAGVPQHQMMSEVALEYGAGKKWRADIVVYGHGGVPMAIVECKRPDVEVTREVLEQALRYNAVLQVPYLFLTNGHLTYICRKTEDGYEFLDRAPVYEEMLKQCRP